MATLELAPTGQTFEVPDQTPLLEIILERRAPIPLGCHAGHCATCMIRVCQGAEALDDPGPIERYTLTRAELAQGIRLACRARLQTGRATVTVYTP